MSWPEACAGTLVREDGTTAEGALALRDAPVVVADASSGTTFDTRCIALDVEVPLGVHELTLNVDPYARATVHLMSSRERAFAPAGAHGAFPFSLYTLRSERNLGIATSPTCAPSARCSASAARRTSASTRCTRPIAAIPKPRVPYSPSSRRWLNWLAIAVDEVPEVRAAAAAALLADPPLRAHASRLRAAGLVDIPASQR